MQVYDITKREVTMEEAVRDKIFRVFVVGLPRTGTSLTMKICEALGVKMFHTTELENRIKMRDEKYRNRFGEYHPNPKGFYEISPQDLFDSFLNALSVSGSGCKLIIPVHGVWVSLMRRIPSRIILTHRDPYETKESQEAFYSKESDVGYLRTAWINQKLAFEKWGLSFMVSEHDDLIYRSSEEIARIKDFVCGEGDVTEIASLVDVNLHRFRKNETVRV